MQADFPRGLDYGLYPCSPSLDPLVTSELLAPAKGEPPAERKAIPEPLNKGISKIRAGTDGPARPFHREVDRWLGLE